MKVDEQIMISNTAICKNIDAFSGDDRGFLSQNILDKLRTFVEEVAVKLAKQEEYSHEIYKNIARPIISSNSKYKFLYKFHENLQSSKSHFSQSEQNSERLMLKYFEYLLNIKKILKVECNLDILENIDRFPLKNDPILKEYYEKIANKIENTTLKLLNTKFNNNYYIWKIKSFFINNEIYYEVTFSVATENNSKFDRVIAFTKIEILPNYSVKLKISNNEIEVFNKKMPILIIEDYEVSIRPCEFENFAKIFDDTIKITRKNKEYEELMEFLTKKRFNLVEIIDFSDAKYKEFKEYVFKKVQTNYIVNTLDKSRNVVRNNKSGKNILRYILYNLNNKIIKNQYTFEKNPLISNLKLNFGCIPFDKMPFCSSPLGHNPRIYDLLDCISFENREHEFLSRFINNNTENNGKLYTEITEISYSENINDLIMKFNGNLYSNKNQQGRTLEIYKNYIYRKSHEEEIVKIINQIKKLSNSGFQGYLNAVEKWIEKNKNIDNFHKIDDPNKEIILKQMFEDSKVALIYGSAGTGKTRLLEHISHFFENNTKLFLANTNPAVNNLQNRVNNKNSQFLTITKYLNRRNNEKYNILVIDECSTVNNSDMLAILEKSEFDLLVLVGDIYQIESINFGNWFSIIKEFIPLKSVFELNTPYRTENEKLKNLWDDVRNIENIKKGEDSILENILPYSQVLNESIFESSNPDEIILCLNYDGLYGINNINRFLQESNSYQAFQWGTHIYKIGDPILFNETSRFSPLIYNNLKGKIIDINISDDKIYFNIEIDKIIEENDVILMDLDILESSVDGKTKIGFSVNKLESTDNDDNYTKNIVPFQVSYAVSIHKSQGLEYNSVKIIISDEIEEMLTHSIFYTAITRARETLKIYWSPETSKKVLENLEPRISRKDAYLLKSKFNL